MKIKMMMAGAVAVSAATMLAVPAFAQDADGMIVSAAVSGGTLGVGPELGLRFSDHLGARADAMFLKVSGDVDSDDVVYRGQLNLESYGLMADVYPLGGHFRISAGARINKNRGRVQATPAGGVELSGTDYTAAQVGTLRGRAEVKEFAPALTLGWSGSRAKGFMFGADVGVLFQGSVKIREFTATGTAAGTPGFRADLEEERRSLQDDVDDYKLYPIVQFKIGYRF